MKKIISIVLTFSLLFPTYASDVENRGSIKIPLKEEIKATKRFQEIKEWKKVRAKKGYILSNDLYYVQRCTPTWDVHVKEFKKENPHIKNPNIISIDQLIKVQTCFSEEKEPVVVEEVKEDRVAQSERKVEEKKNENIGIFGIVSGQFNKSGNGVGNRASQGIGIKAELGKYFEVSEDNKIKASVGVLMNETELDNSKEKTQKTTMTGDVSYLFKISEKMSLGPNLGVFAGQSFEDHEKSRNDRISAFGGVNVDYKLNERIFLDLKVLNELEGRVNLNTTFGLGINF